jgi:PEP-CTERM motif-containing protein
MGMKDKCARSSAFRRLSILYFMVVVLACPSAFAASTTLTPSADATLFETETNNSAGGDGFFISGTTQNRTRNRALLQFDIASAVPAGSQITGIGLQLEVTRVPGCGFEPSLFGFHRVLRSWGEGDTIVIENMGGQGAPAAPGDATWNNRFHDTQPWGVPGGAPGIDYVPDFSGSVFLFGTDVYSVEGTPNMLSDVQYWLDNPQANFGWMLISTSEDLPFTARRFASSEDPNGGGPVMFIDYEPVPEPATWALLGAGALFLAAWRRARR